VIPPPANAPTQWSAISAVLLAEEEAESYVAAGHPDQRPEVFYWVRVDQLDRLLSLDASIP
jgi:hypothetical protein